MGVSPMRSSASESRSSGKCMGRMPMHDHIFPQNRLRCDPKTNGGERGEVAIKGISNGNPMGSGPGGSMIADIQIRWCLSRGDSGIYTYCIFDHKPDYPATSVGEARFCAKLNDAVFDWMT